MASANFVAAESSFKAVLSTPSAPPAVVRSARTNLASLYRTSGAHKDIAIDLYKELADTDGKDAEATAILACLLQETPGRESEARPYYQRLRGVVSASVNILIAQGNEALVLKDVALARQVCEQWSRRGQRIDSAAVAAAQANMLASLAFLLLERATSANASGQPVTRAQVDEVVAAYSNVSAHARRSGIALSPETQLNIGVANTLAVVVGAN